MAPPHAGSFPASQHPLALGRDCLVFTNGTWDRAWHIACGPQIMFTTLYLSGGFPLSAQFGNAIPNDGDALFPAIAIAPKAALVATL